MLHVLLVQVSGLEEGIHYTTSQAHSLIQSNTSKSSAKVFDWGELARPKDHLSNVHTPVCVVQRGRCRDVDFASVPNEPLHQAETSSRAQIIVTRYQEDVRWLDAMPEIPTIIYNRGGQDSSLPRQRDNLMIISSANSGREDEAMLRHIAKNYDSLPEVTVFLQGWPFKHCQNIANAVRRAVRQLLDSNMGDDKFQQLAAPGNAEVIPISSTVHTYNLQIGAAGIFVDMVRSQFSPGTMEEEVRNAAAQAYRGMCASIMGNSSRCPNVQRVAEGAQWAVRKKAIYRQPLEFYQKAAELGEGEFGELRGLVLEAMWPVLWANEKWAEDFLARATVKQSISHKGTPHYRLDEGCLTDDTALLHSCAAKMAVCEFQWREERQAPSNDFLKGRQLLQVGAHPQHKDWSMNVTLRKPKIFGPTESFIVDSATMRVQMKEASGTQWVVIPKKRGLLFKTVLPDVGGVYLGCDQGSASVSVKQQLWRVLRRGDSLLTLKMVGASLWLVPGKKQIHCSQRRASIDISILQRSAVESLNFPF